jgi:hypothetical protein
MCFKIAQLALQKTRILPVLLVPPKILPLAGLKMDRFQLAFLRFFWNLKKFVEKKLEMKNASQNRKTWSPHSKQFLSNCQILLFFHRWQMNSNSFNKIPNLQNSQFLPIRNLCFSFEIFVETNRKLDIDAKTTSQIMEINLETTKYCLWHKKLSWDSQLYESWNNSAWRNNLSDHLNYPFQDFVKNVSISSKEFFKDWRSPMNLKYFSCNQITFSFLN